MRRTLRLLRGSSRGVTLIEVLIAMALVGIIAAAFLGGLATASRSAALADIRTNAESLARSELEYAKSQMYTTPPWEYDVSVQGSSCITDPCPDWWSSERELHGEYAGYTVTVRSDELLDDPNDPTTEKDGIQMITVTVFHHSREEAVTVLSGYRVDR